jgi:hypothetical protein
LRTSGGNSIAARKGGLFIKQKDWLFQKIKKGLREMMIQTPAATEKRFLKCYLPR